MENKELEIAIKYLKEMQVKYAEKAKDYYMLYLQWYALKIAIRELETNRWIPTNEKLPRLRNDFFQKMF